MTRFDYESARKYGLERPGAPLIDLRIVEARGLLQRGLGLVGREADRLPEGCGILFDGCRSVHTFGMRAPISLIWLGPVEDDGARRVVSLDSSVPPNRVAFAPRGACAVIERAAIENEGGKPVPWRLIPMAAATDRAEGSERNEDGNS